MVEQTLQLNDAQSYNFNFVLIFRLAVKVLEAVLMHAKRGVLSS